MVKPPIPAASISPPTRWTTRRSAWRRSVPMDDAKRPICENGRATAN